MSATRDFTRWATEIVNDPSYPTNLPKTEEMVAIYVVVAEALAEAAIQQKAAPGQAVLPWIPSGAAAQHFVN